MTDPVLLDGINLLPSRCKYNINMQLCIGDSRCNLSQSIKQSLVQYIAQFNISATNEGVDFCLASKPSNFVSFNKVSNHMFVFMLNYHKF